MLVMFKELNEEQKEEFCDAFYECSPLTRKEIAEDGETDTPWGCPWYYTESAELEGTTPAEWGESYYEQCREEFEGIIEEYRKAVAEQERLNS